MIIGSLWNLPSLSTFQLFKSSILLSTCNFSSNPKQQPSNLPLMNYTKKICSRFVSRLRVFPTILPPHCFNWSIISRLFKNRVEKSNLPGQIYSFGEAELNNVSKSRNTACGEPKTNDVHESFFFAKQSFRLARWCSVDIHTPEEHLTCSLWVFSHTIDQKVFFRFFASWIISFMRFFLISFQQ